VTVTQTSVIGVSLDDGQLLWEFPFPGAAGGTMPVIDGQHIIVSALDSGVAAIRPSRRADKWVVDAVWHTGDVSMYLSNPVVVGDTLFGFSHRSSGQFFALDTASGQVRWLGPAREASNSAIAKAGNLLFLLKDDAELIVARANRTQFEPLRRYTVADSPTWAQPAISGNRIFIKDATSLTLWTVD
jgi:outer membrane protein assembly factor BamB